MEVIKSKSKRKPHIAKVSYDVIVGRVYRFFNSCDDLIYIGSTTLSLVKRLADHVYSLNHNVKSPLYEHIRLTGLKNWTIELLEAKFVKNIVELRKLEQTWIDEEKSKQIIEL